MSFFNDALKAAKSAGAAASDTARKAVDAGVGAKDTVVMAGTSAIERGLAAKQAMVDTATDTADAVVGYARATKDAAVMTYEGFQSYGLIVGMIVAPVPTLIGYIMMELMVSMAQDRFASVSRDIQANRQAREKDQLIEKLAKYGKIPATAIVETESASLRLDTVAGTITGTVKTGFFSNRDIAEMSVPELEKFAESSDAETAKLIRAYVRFRKQTA